MHPTEDIKDFLESPGISERILLKTSKNGKKDYHLFVL